MEIKTKFNIGDTIYYMKNNRVCKNKVSQIEVKVYVTYKRDIKYKVELCPELWIPEYEAFGTKQDLINSL